MLTIPTIGGIAVIAICTAIWKLALRAPRADVWWHLLLAGCVVNWARAIVGILQSTQ